MIVGIDGGFTSFKAVGPEDRCSHIDSIVGSVNKARFTLRDTSSDIIIEVGDGPQRMVGGAAVRQSRFTSKNEDANWIETDEYLYLMASALSEMTMASRTNIQVITGLPLAFYQEKQRKTLYNRWMGTHRIKREGRNAQVFEVDDCRIIPQAFGAVFAKAIDENGRLLNNIFTHGTVGIIDIGGKTTNILSVSNLEEIAAETDSVEIGGWDAIRELRSFIQAEYPEKGDMKDHTLIEIVKSDSMMIYDQPVDLSAPIGAILKPMGSQVVGAAKSLWGSGANLQAIVVVGGGAILLQSLLKDSFPHLTTFENPVFANATGFYRYGLFIARNG